MRARGSDMFACVRLRSIFGRRFPGVNVREEGAWQAEGQTWCSSAEWASAAGSSSCCGLDIILEQLPALSHQPAALVWLLFIKRERARKKKSNLERADNREQDWIELLWLFGCNYSITIDKMTVFSLSSFNFSLLNNQRPEFWWERRLEISSVCRAAWQHAAAPALIKSTLRHI